MDVTDHERDLIEAGVAEWFGPLRPLRPTDAIAVAMGFANAADLVTQAKVLAGKLGARGFLTVAEWQRALVITEIAFASDTLGSGREWSLTTGFADDETIVLLRGVQRKLAAARQVVRESPRTPSRPG